MTLDNNQRFVYCGIGDKGDTNLVIFFMDKTARITIAHILDLTINWLLVGLTFFIPFFFLSMTGEMFFVNKHLLLFATLSLALILWAATFIVRRKVTITVSPALLPVALLAIFSVASVLVAKSSLPEALVGRSGLAIALFLFVLIGSSRPSGVARWLTTTMILSSALLALWTVLSFTGLSELILPYTISGKTFTPTGSMNALVVLLVGTLPLVVNRIRTTPREQALKKLTLVSAATVVLAGAIIAGFLIFPGQESAPARMPMSVGWQIAVETLKQQPFFGVGTGNYLSAYTRFRPITTNNSTLWNQRFQQAPNEFFHQFTENGLLGLMALLFLVWKLYGLFQLSGQPRTPEPAQKEADGWIATSLTVVILSLLLFPLNVITVVELSVFSIILILELKASQAARAQIYDATVGLVALREGLVQVDKTYPAPALPGVSGIQAALSGLHLGHGEKSTNFLSWIIALPLFAAAGFSLFLVSRAWAAEITYKQALDAIAKNNGTLAYNKLIQTLTINPLFDTYHRQYADINLRLANSLAAQPKLSDADRANVGQLVQQAIREAKVAAQLNPTDVRNWEALAVIYRAIINVADGARDWTVIAYSEAIRLDPYNPLLRLDLGGVFYNSKDWENAIRSFQAATSLKPDFANGYYNQALAYEQDNRPKEALRAIQATVQNLDTNSPDYAVAQQKLEELTKKAQQALKSEPATTAATGINQEERLSAPQPIPTPLPGANRVKLSQQEAPPPTATPTPPSVGELSPTPTVGQ